MERLSHMAVAGPESSFLEYTKEWIKIVNRGGGGLFEVNDSTFHLFVSVELVLGEKLKEHLHRSAVPTSECHH